MRTLLTIKVPAAKGSQALSDGSFQEVLQKIMADLQPEAVYFGIINGCRGAFVVFDLKDPSQIPSIGEPLFRALEAEVDFQPVMNQEDLMKGIGAAG